MKELIRFQYLANASYLQNELFSYSIYSHIQPNVNEYVVLIANNHYHQALAFTNSIDFDESPVSVQLPYLSLVTEWYNHMYDIGYWTGGTVPHFFYTKVTIYHILFALFSVGMCLLVQLR